MSNQTKKDAVFVAVAGKCPRCASPDVMGGEITVEGVQVRQKCLCENCRFIFTNHYTYSYSTASKLPETEEDEIKRRVFELTSWPGGILPSVKDPDEITALECSQKLGEITDAAVRIHGLGYTVDFEGRSYGRCTAYDSDGAR